MLFCYSILIIFGITPLVYSQIISKQKCLEYNKKVEKCENNPLPLIVGGTEADEKEFPHMALIGFGSDPVVYECGGTLISETFVLSAAHCKLSKESGPATRVKLGIIDRDYDGPAKQEEAIIEVITHPEYQSTVKYHDIALFKLEKPITINDYVKPACLNFNKKKVTNEVAISIGFGKLSFTFNARESLDNLKKCPLNLAYKSFGTSSTDGEGSTKLNKVSLPILDLKACTPFYKTAERTYLPKGLINKMICAGVLEGGKDSCQGDSGGPLQIYMEEPYCTYSVIGVISFGKFCGYAKSPGIYTNIYEYLPWIEKNVWE